MRIDQMNTLNTEIKKRLTPFTMPALEMFCTIINRSTADRFVVMAHKALCIFQSLIDLGYINEEISQKYISSTALEYIKSISDNERIAVVDDIIISGSAISSTVNRLIDMGAKEENIEIITFARNREYQRIQFIRKDGTDMLSYAVDTDDAECIQMSYDIVNMLAYVGKPYETDFPLCTKIYADLDMQKKIFNSIFADVFDVSNDIHTLAKLDTVTIFPKKFLIDEVWAKVGVNLDDLVVLKIRTYCHNLSDSMSIISFVPMALFNEIAESDIDAILSIKSLSPMRDQFANWSYKTKMHFLQYYISWIFCKVFISKIHGISLCVNESMLSIIFGEELAETVLTCLNDESIPEKIVTLSGTPMPIVMEDRVSSFTISDIKTMIHTDDECGYLINKRLYELFKNWYVNEELSTRDNLKLKSYHYDDKEYIPESMKRLTTGFSLNSLLKSIHPLDKIFNTKYLISLFIDRGVDNGIIVPIIYHDSEKHFLCRAYRHGEDLPFGEGDKRRLLYFLSDFDKKIRAKNGNKVEHIARITFEKIIVLFYQMGLKKNLFNRFFGFDNSPVLLQQYCVHGTVGALQKEFNKTPHFYMSRESNTSSYDTERVSAFLENEDYVTFHNDQEESKKYYTINSSEIEDYLSNNRLSNMSYEIQNTIEIISTIISEWLWDYFDSNKRDKFKNNIIALTSCADVYTFASAIATEVHYFKRYWDEQVGPNIKSQNYEADFKSMQFEQALKSGRDKHNWYKANVANDVIKEVDQLLKKKNLKVETSFWEDCWLSELKAPAGGSTNFNELLRKALLFLYFYSAAYKWLSEIRFKSSNQISFIESDEEIKGYYDNYSRLKRDSDYDAFQLFHEATTWNNKNISDNLLSAFSYNISQSKNIINEIESGLDEKTSTYTVRYNTLILLYIKAPDCKEVDNIIQKTYNEEPESYKKATLNFALLDASQDNIFKYGLFIQDDDEDSCMYLLRFYLKIEKKAVAYMFPTNAIFIRNSLKQFKQNLRKNIQSTISDFNEGLDNSIKLISLKPKNFLKFDYVHKLSFLCFMSSNINFEKSFEAAVKNHGYHGANKEASIEYPVCSLSCFKKGVKNGNLKHVKSAVLVKVNEVPKGTGILVRYLGKVFCISCRHIFRGYDNLHIVAQTNDDQNIQLVPLNHKPNLQESLKANEDILVCDVDLSDVYNLSYEDIFDLDEHDDGGEYFLHGYADQWHIAGPIKNPEKNGHGYMDAESKSEIKNGYSGAPIYTHKSEILIGMHAKSKTLTDKIGIEYIPIDDIKNIIEDLQEVK